MFTTINSFSVPYFSYTFSKNVNNLNTLSFIICNPNLTSAQDTNPYTMRTSDKKQLTLQEQSKLSTSNHDATKMLNN